MYSEIKPLCQVSPGLMIKNSPFFDFVSKLKSFFFRAPFRFYTIPAQTEQIVFKSFDLSHIAIFTLSFQVLYDSGVSRVNCFLSFDPSHIAEVISFCAD